MSKSKSKRPWQPKFTCMVELQDKDKIDSVSDENLATVVDHVIIMASPLERLDKGSKLEYCGIYC